MDVMKVLSAQATLKVLVPGSLRRKHDIAVGCVVVGPRTPKNRAPQCLLCVQDRLNNVGIPWTHLGNETLENAFLRWGRAAFDKPPSFFKERRILGVVNPEEGRYLVLLGAQVATNFEHLSPFENYRRVFRRVSSQARLDALLRKYGADSPQLETARQITANACARQFIEWPDAPLITAAA